MPPPITYPQPTTMAIAGRAEVSCDALRARAPLVILAYGQSIASNFNQETHASAEGIYSWFDRRCYRAVDPMLGADGDSGSMWSFLGDQLASGSGRPVIFVTIGVGGSSITRWDTGGDLNPKLLQTVDEIVAAGFPPAVILWHHGSADRGSMPGDVYAQHFRGMMNGVAAHGVQFGAAFGRTRVFIAVHSICGQTDSDPEITKGQRSLVAEAAGFFSGANTDTLGSDYRFDGCHLNGAGQRAAASLWANSLADAVSRFGEN